MGLLIKYKRVWVILISHGLSNQSYSVSLYSDRYRLLPPTQPQPHPLQVPFILLASPALGLLKAEGSYFVSKR